MLRVLVMKRTLVHDWFGATLDVEERNCFIFAAWDLALVSSPSKFSLKWTLDFPINYKKIKPHVIVGFGDGWLGGGLYCDLVI